MTSKRVITSEEWEKKRQDVHIPLEDLNKLVMNFLVAEVCPPVIICAIEIA